jgi:hypothetical protein
LSTFPTIRSGLSSDTVWWTVLTVCVGAVAVSVNSRPLHGDCPAFGALALPRSRRPAGVERVPLASERDSKGSSAIAGVRNTNLPVGDC